MMMQTMAGELFPSPAALRTLSCHLLTVAASLTLLRGLSYGVQIVHPDSGNIEAREGGEITFICEGTNNKAVTWYFNNVLLESDGHFHIRSEDIHGEEATKQTTLYIPNVGLEDSGVYHCEEDGDPLGKQMIQLSVLQHARAVQIVTPREGRLEVREGKEITLKCVGDRTSRLEWLHNGRLLLKSIRPRIMFTVSRDFQTNAKYSIMTRRSADAAAAGTYLCRNSRHKRDNDSVTVHVKPATESTVVIVKPNRERVTIPWRVAYQMRCKSPATTSVHWKLYNRRITADTTDSRYSLREDLQGDWRYLTMTLLDPSGDSQGSYVCVENGNEDNKAQVYVMVETRQVEVTVTTTTEDGHEVPSETRKVLLRVGSNEKLECSLSGGANQGIVADWTKDGIKLQEGPKFGIFRSGSMIGLNIRNTDQDDDGTYKCSFRHVNNEVVSECVFTVATVECPPLLTPANGSTMDCPSRPRYGDTCSFRCNQGFQLHGTSTRTCELDTRSQPRWTGEQVTCLSPADNHCKVKRQMTKVVMRVGDSLRLPCNGRGYWSKQGHGPLQGQKYRIENGQLIIGTTTRDDIGVYNCSIKMAGYDVIMGIKMFNVSTLPCPRPPAPSRGRMVGCSSRPVYGETCIFTCEHGYHLTSGSRTRTCDLLHKGGNIQEVRWTGTTPTCKKKVAEVVDSNGATTRTFHLKQPSVGIVLVNFIYLISSYSNNFMSGHSV